MTILQSLEGLDRWLFRLLNGSGPIGWFDGLMLAVSNQWSILLLLPLFVAQARAVVPTWRRVLLITGLAAALLGVVDGSASLLKQQFERPRPCNVLSDVRAVAPCSGSPSLPSNHAANTFALAAFTVACTRRRPVLWFGVAAVAAYSRVRLGVHYPFDVLVGALWGAALGWIAGCATRRWLVTPPPPLLDAATAGAAGLARDRASSLPTA
jgi:undecaprenyl-diphosphatase